jgi:hypothetical protein
MKRAWKGFLQVLLVLVATAVVGAADTATMPPPGTLNYVEGQVSLEGKKLTPKSVGSTYLETDQVLDTHNGNAEVLLTPGVYLRVGHNSELKMLSPELADTQVQLMSGSAILEVDELFKENDVSVVVDGATTTILKHGLYAFNAQSPAVSVLDGKAMVSEGGRQARLGKGREVLLTNDSALSSQKYDKKQFEVDPLYRWSKLRSEYASESNVETANALALNGGWYGPGWYWDPFFWDYAFLPGNGMFWGPFGGAFFSPGWAYMAPYYGYYGGYRGYYHYGVSGSSGSSSGPASGHFAGPGGGRGVAPARGTFSSGMRGNMGSGGFHGGGFGGGAMRGGFSRR